MPNTIDQLKARGETWALHQIMHNDTDWLTRLDAAEALAELHDPRGLAYLNSALHSPDAEVREVAAEILSGLGISTLTSIESIPPAATSMDDANTSMEASHSRLTKAAEAISICVGITCFLLVGLLLILPSRTIGAITESPMVEVIFEILLFGTPVASLVSICLGMMAKWEGQPRDTKPPGSLALAWVVLGIFLFWHFLGLGLIGDYYPCLVDTVALVLAVLWLVIFRIGRPKHEA